MRASKALFLGSVVALAACTAAPPEPVAESEAPVLSCARAAAARTAPVALWDRFLADLPALAGPARRERADRFLADVAAAGGTPLEDPATGRVVFLATTPPPSDAWRVGGSFTGWSPSGFTLGEVADTGVWAAETQIRPGAAYEYKLVAGGRWMEDRLAKNVVWDGIDRGFGVRGELNAVGHPGDAPADRGRMLALGKVHATQLGNDRDVFVYYPAAYDQGSCPRLPSIVFHDGLESLARGAFARVADDLYAARPELAAVLVFVDLPDPNVRMAEYTFASEGSRGDAYVDFLGNDLWPRLAADARLCSAPAARGISGASLGGLISTHAGFSHPEAWGWVGAQSPSYFWAGEAMIERARSEPRKPLRIYLDSGCPNDNCVVTDRFAEVLAAKGYDFTRVRRDGAAHDWAFWRDRLPLLLTHFREGQLVCDGSTR